MRRTLCAALLTALAGAGCVSVSERAAPTAADAQAAASASVSPSAPTADYIGTREPFASDAVYFVVTDRFVNGDPTNDQREQGGANRTFDRPVPGAPKGRTANIGYLGGDFKGILDNAEYIADMGFGALWLTPVVDNPDEAFLGGEPVKWGGMHTDQGKTGYHGYWGVNFFELDEHLPSRGLDFRALTAGLKQQGLKTVLDIVANHGSPSYSAPVDQPKFGELYDRDSRLIADHQNLHPSKLDRGSNPLHRWYNTSGGLAQLSDIDSTQPEVLDYFVDAYSQWIDQGADAFRIDTIGWMPHEFWNAFSQRIREKRPGFFMFAEAFDHDAATIAQHTLPRNAGVSVLDFPLKERLVEVFGKQGGGYERIAERLYLTDGPYANPYELMTFYDNHDMPRIDARDTGFIDAHHFLFTARGIPVIYYGSEVGFERGSAEHAGNRNYFGQKRVDAAVGHPIRESLKRIGTLRANTPALQRGLQVNLAFKGDRAAFYRVLQDGATQQIALVLLNKGDAPARFEIREHLQAGAWRAALGGGSVAVAEGGALEATVPAHGAEVYLLDASVTQPGLRAALNEAMRRARREG
ncbi:alpha-amylase family glycosyl hydrolase [Cognatilysobacter bugurensis]|uniref:Cyclomaltodextrin glucanotransferase n=1 Tax=Cognatilysobacter bugurensis TaxID=543356 RepID=A0A918T3B5_9GAMM|nr:alpha-amylase family glycosyl hydrolase [Lysobacter bugurensis]GHA81717.1 cyclomaltodextrin glucanotransferase [Lysobacter bugurensis]